MTMRTTPSMRVIEMVFSTSGGSAVPGPTSWALAAAKNIVDAPASINIDMAMLEAPGTIGHPRKRGTRTSLAACARPIQRIARPCTQAAANATSEPYGQMGMGSATATSSIASAKAPASR